MELVQARCLAGLAGWSVVDKMKTRFPYRYAMEVAEAIQSQLQPDCDRILIAGSLRREKSEVGDIELLFVPLMVSEPDGLFDTRQCDLAERKINELVTSGVLERRLNVNGHQVWGQKNKLARHLASGIPVDFFSTTAENWHVATVIRTGSKETNLRLTTGAQRQGMRLNAYGCGVTMSDGTIIPATSERHVFDLCRIAYLEPKDR